MDDVAATILMRGKPTLTGVTISFMVGGAFVHGSGSWSGSFNLPAGGFISHGGPYELLLEDGRRGLILVRETRSDEGGGVTVEFTGVGPFPHSG